MKLGLGLGIGGSGNSLPRYVTDFANGFELTGDTYTGGPTTVADYEGTLVTSPADVLPIEGDRLTDGVWCSTDLSGDPIHTSTPLRTTKGTVQKYAETYKGPLIEPARTNKVTCRKSNPVDTTNTVYIASDASTFSVFTESAATLADAVDENGQSVDLTSLCTSLKVYDLDNRAGSTLAYVTLGGTTGNTNLHGFAAYLLGSFIFGDNGSLANRITATTAKYTRKEGVHTPNSATSTMLIRADAGQRVRFILPQLEEGAFLTSPICKASDGSDPLTSLTRPAANLTRPTAGTALAALNNWATLIRFRPTAAGQTAAMWGSYTDANNATRLDLAPTTLTFTKRLAGVDHVAQASLTHAADTLYEALLYQHSVHGMGIAFRSWDGSAWSAWSTWVDLTDANGIANASIAATYQNGAVNNSSHVCANMPFVSVIALPASVEPQAWLMSQLAKGRI